MKSKYLHSTNNCQTHSCRCPPSEENQNQRQTMTKLHFNSRNHSSLTKKLHPRNIIILPFKILTHTNEYKKEQRTVITFSRMFQTCGNECSAITINCKMFRTLRIWTGFNETVQNHFRKGVQQNQDWQYMIQCSTCK